MFKTPVVPPIRAMTTMRARRAFLAILTLLSCLLILHLWRLAHLKDYILTSANSPADGRPTLEPGEPKPSVDDQVPSPSPIEAAAKKSPKYKSAPSYTPPPVKDPFPALATSLPPPIPSYNVPKKHISEEYALDTPPPLLIGFTRSYPMLLQCVVSYITAGWPAEQIYVVENTGTHQANARGQLHFQHPFYLNHTSLERLGVNVVQTPVLLTFAQLQNFFLSLSYAHDWSYYFWSHTDSVALSHEDGLEGVTPPAIDPGYKSLYTCSLGILNHTLHTDDRWGMRFFAYDHLTLVNPKAFEDIGGWDTFIPYYITDCDAHSRLAMQNWSVVDVNCGIITDTSTVLDDLLALYRVPSVTPSFSDPNPPPPDDGAVRKRVVPPQGAALDLHNPLDYWRLLQKTCDDMFHYKNGNKKGRNTWQAGQRGGQTELFYYDTDGFTEAFEVLSEAGKEVFRRKWGHRDCDLIGGAGLKIEDQWRVEKDWD